MTVKTYFLGQQPDLELRDTWTLKPEQIPSMTTPENKPFENTGGKGKK